MPAKGAACENLLAGRSILESKQLNTPFLEPFAEYRTTTLTSRAIATFDHKIAHMAHCASKVVQNLKEASW